MAQGTWPGDLRALGNITGASFTLTASCVTDTHVAVPTVGSGIGAGKVMHRFDKQYAQAAAANVVNAQVIVHVVRGTTATVNEIVIVPVVTVTGNDNVAIDLLKNGSSILNTPVTLTNTAANYSKTTGVVTAGGTGMAAGDVIEVKLTANHGTGTLAQGLGVQVQIDESPA